jgi:hypothetical protein
VSMLSVVMLIVLILSVIKLSFKLNIAFKLIILSFAVPSVTAKCGKKSFRALTQLQQEQSRVKKRFTLFQILVT